VKIVHLYALYGFTLSVDNSRTSLFPYVFGFDLSTYEIAVGEFHKENEILTQNFSHPEPTNEGPLRTNRAVTIGLGTDDGGAIEFKPNAERLPSSKSLS
jgi:hypothetical protein